MKAKMMARRLQGRQVAYAQLKTVLRDQGPVKRLQTGGYRCPGSPKRN